MMIHSFQGEPVPRIRDRLLENGSSNKQEVKNTEKPNNEQTMTAAA